MEIVLDGKEIVNRKRLFKQLKLQINSEEFVGNNLDAIWDVLYYANKEVNITIVNHKDFNYNLGNYAKMLLDLFEDLRKSNNKITIDYK